MSSSTSIYGGSEDFTVIHVLRIMDDNIKAIEDINTNGVFSTLVSQPQNQENTNAAMDRYITTLEAMLLWEDPDVAGYSGNKSTYTDAITLGKAYITENT